MESEEAFNKPICKDYSFLSQLRSPGEILVGSRDGTVLDVLYDTNLLEKYKISFEDGSFKECFRSSIKKMDEPDIGVIPKTAKQLGQDALLINKSKLDQVLCPKVLSDTEKEFMHWYHRLKHLPYSKMMVLAQAKVLPFKFT